MSKMNKLGHLCLIVLLALLFVLVSCDQSITNDQTTALASTYYSTEFTENTETTETAETTQVTDDETETDTHSQTETDSEEITTETETETESGTEAETATETETETETETATETEAETETDVPHSWTDADCITPKTCTVCGATEGEALGHTGGVAVCGKKAECERCGESYGLAGEHQYDACIPDEQYLYMKATLYEKAKYYRSCSLCGRCGRTYFEYGETLLEIMANEYKNEGVDGSTVEKFIYFTDPHFITAEENAVWREGAMYQLERIKLYYDTFEPSFIVCGGDWLNNSNSRENAKQMLTSIRKTMDRFFGAAYLVLGNHDYNYQTIKDGKTVQGEHELTYEELSEVWFSEYGKTYYSFEGENTKFYVFDSGKDWGHYSMTEIDIAQAEWFLESLSSSDDSHIALLPHMLFVRDDIYNPGTETYAMISAAYNAREVFEFNGQTYDFSQKTGKVEFIMAGHSHNDYVGSIHGIPYVITRISKNPDPNGDPSVDIVCVNYDKGTIEMTRMGTGESRTVSLVAE